MKSKANKGKPAKGNAIPDSKPENSYKKGAKAAIKARKADKRK